MVYLIHILHHEKGVRAISMCDYQTCENIYAQARSDAGFTREVATEKIYCSLSALARYESGKVTPNPRTVLNMARAYKKPELTQIYCRKNCEIGAAYSYDILNQVNMDVISILTKLQTEMREVNDIFFRMMELATNKNSKEDFIPQEWEEFQLCIHELLDIEHTIEMLKISLGRWTDMSIMVSQHNLKCHQRGYVVQKQKPAPARVAEKRVGYQIKRKKLPCRSSG